ncbi:MAG: hypothetical protein ACR2FV_05950 [Ornithinimicrobium sp.]
MVPLTDVLIRNVDEQALRRLDAEAGRLGLSRNEDLGDDEVMSQAWS